MKRIYIIIRIFAPIINLLTDIVNIFIWRDKKIILFGSWMGNRFADNSRYLFQHMSDYKEQYKFKKVIWVTRNKTIYKTLKSMGYDTYMMYSLQSIYYHFKAGVHIICNQSYPVKGYAGDIMGQLSGRAIKINMWHGIPLKAGKSTGENIKKNGLLGQIRFYLKTNSVFNFVFSPGHWNKAYYFSTGKECTRRLAVFLGVNEKQFLNVGYPRTCKLERYLDEEKGIISKIRSYSKTILFVPTFRENGDVPHPLDSLEILEYIKNNDILWIEKPHSALKEEKIYDLCKKNIMNLNGNFDINSILPEISLLITDYSSVCYDAMAYSKPVLFYDADYNHYLNDERGFLCDYKAEVRGIEADSSEKLLDLIKKFWEDSSFRIEVLNKVEFEKKRLYDEEYKNCKDIFIALNKYIDFMK